MRVLMISRACMAGIYQRKLEEIAARAVELLTLVPPYWRDGSGTTRLERLHTRGYRLETTAIRANGHFHLHHYPELGAALRDFRPDVLHVDEEPYNLAAWQALRLGRRYGCRTLFFCWQNILRRYPPPFSLGERYVLRGADHAIAGTTGAADVLRAKGYGGPLSVIPQFGVDPQRFRPAGERPSRPFTIGYFGRFVPEKGLHSLLEALTLLDRDCHLLAVGDGPLRPHLETMVIQLNLHGRVRLEAAQPSSAMPAQYGRIDALVLPSLTRRNWKEQFGRVLIEAMASGVPVVGSDSGAIPDVIGDAGLVFPEGDAAALAGKLRRLQREDGLRRHLAQRGRERATLHFTHAGVADATVAVYRELTDFPASS
ncbi:MAG: glycosyltransferase family 4 protein [Anaerolineaceae bacterium]|nr:glycosyltransferase family 4 protein [Anaerolineaceae bacterium]